MSYWIASNKSPVEQRSVSIPAETGTDYIPGQEIRIRIDPSLKYFNPSESFLEFDTQIVPPTYTANDVRPTKLQLDAETGGQVLCRTIRIHDNNGTLLEEIDNYNTMVAMKYDYHTNDSLRGKRALTEGSTMYNHQFRGTLGTTKSSCDTRHTNPYFKTGNGASFNQVHTADDFLKVKCCLPLHTGIMGSDKIFPNHLLGGITITILLEDANRVFRQLDSAMQFRRLPLNPLFDEVNAVGAGILDPVTSIPLADDGTFLSVDFQQENSNANAPKQFPFVVGEKLGFQRQVAGNASVIAFTGGEAGKPEIASIDVSQDKIRVILNASVTVAGKGMDSGAQEIFAFSDSVRSATSYDATYQVTNVNLVCQEVMPSAEDERKMMSMLKEGGSLNYDFLSATCYKYSQLSSDRVANIRLPINNSRAKSIICVPTDATVYTTKENINASLTYKVCQLENLNASNFYLRSNRSGLVGISDHVSDYQWLYNGRLQPNRKVSLSKVSSDTSIDAQHLLELDKSLSQAGITAHSFQQFNQNFCIGRALALGDGVYDARNKDFSLQINYNEATAPAKNKLWCNYVFHIRRIEIKNGNVQVIV